MHAEDTTFHVPDFVDIVLSKTFEKNLIGNILN